MLRTKYLYLQFLDDFEHFIDLHSIRIIRGGVGIKKDHLLLNFPNDLKEDTVLAITSARYMECLGTFPFGTLNGRTVRFRPAFSARSAFLDKRKLISD